MGVSCFDKTLEEGHREMQRKGEEVRITKRFKGGSPAEITVLANKHILLPES